MAADRWPSDRPVADLLFEAGERFDFYQAVKLLERLRPGCASVGEGIEPGREAVRFASNVRLSFPAGDVAEVRRPRSPDAPAEMVVNFMGLAGHFGPLPAPYTELILERVWRKDTALRDFLDLFNHRLVSLMYRVRKQHRIALAAAPPDQGPVARALLALIGLGTPGLRERMRVRDRALLLYAGLLAQQRRSMAGLERLLGHYFDAPVRGRQLVGRWLPLDEDQRTALGVTGRNQHLGQGAVLGRRAWDQQGAFVLHLGPLALSEFLAFLPTGSRFRPLCELTRFYVRREFHFTVRLTLRAADVPALRLGLRYRRRLGWTTWLKTRPFPADDSQVHLSPDFDPRLLGRARPA
jgi:type VI secretion system protein ImpH